MYGKENTSCHIYFKWTLLHALANTFLGINYWPFLFFFFWKKKDWVCYYFSYSCTLHWRGFLVLSWYLALEQYVLKNPHLYFNIFSLAFVMIFALIFFFLVLCEGFNRTIAIKLPLNSYAIWCRALITDQLCIFIEECALCKCILVMNNFVLSCSIQQCIVILKLWLKLGKEWFVLAVILNNGHRTGWRDICIVIDSLCRMIFVNSNIHTYIHTYIYCIGGDFKAV